MKTNNKVKLINLATNILAETNINDLETVEVSETHYDDGSVGLSINLTYPADKAIPESENKLLGITEH